MTLEQMPDSELKELEEIIKNRKQPMFKAFDEIVQDRIDLLTEEDIDWILSENPTRESMIEYHHSMGMHIRNEYHLWDEENPLTKAWSDARKSNNEDYIIDGADCHPAHPDEVSMNVLYKIWDHIHSLQESNTYFTVENAVRRLDARNEE